ncbi:GIY-YIG nuclease family protein [Draconibacterium halophilum]|uniref:GIY-YIG nuclease family protein n=1 Tax=Draconibacterium halophilum TaxID=2706887 RepID=A0A6C0RCX7_9BACT|nr:GIY-YIG nuclease family protein [Draconibacterium halophilum]
MKYYVYIIYSLSTDTYYKGQTSCLDSRLSRHNSGYEKSTQHGAPWKLVWSTTKATRGEALYLEKKLKNLSRQKTLEFIKKYS